MTLPTSASGAAPNENVIRASEDEFESLKKILRELTNKKGQLVIHD